MEEFNSKIMKLDEKQKEMALQIGQELNGVDVFCDGLGTEGIRNFKIIAGYPNGEEETVSIDFDEGMDAMDYAQILERTFCNNYKRYKYMNKKMEDVLMKNKNYKLFTGTTIGYDKVIVLKQEVEGHNDIETKYLLVDMDNMVKALESITYDNILDKPIKDRTYYVEMLINYCNLIRTLNGEYCITLNFDEYDEQEYSLMYKLSAAETEKCKKLCDDGKLSYMVNLLNKPDTHMVLFTDHELTYIKLAFTNILNSKAEGYVNTRKHLDEETLKDMTLLLNRLEEANTDEKLNKTLQETIYYGLGLWAFVDAGMITRKDLMDFFKSDGADDEIYCNIFGKIMAAC